jgi:hypothetical protein
MVLLAGPIMPKAMANVALLMPRRKWTNAALNSIIPCRLTWVGKHFVGQTYARIQIVHFLKVQ